MVLPIDYDTVIVRGRYVYLDGTPAIGDVKFTGQVVATSAATDTIIVPNTIVAPLDGGGQFSVALPATNDPDVTPNGWTYTVLENLTGGGGRTYSIDVPVSAKVSGIDLSDVAPITPSTGDPTAFVTLSTFQDYVNSHAGGATDWTQINNKPTTFPPAVHTHPQSDITGLTSALTAKADASALATKADASTLTAHTSNTSNPHAVTKAQVGLGNADNTSDLNKPISTATQAALDLKATVTGLSGHTADTNNPHAVTKTQVGLPNVDNTSDIAKPISTATQAALDAKTDILVLATGAPVPGGTRVGTIILRT